MKKVYAIVHAYTEEEGDYCESFYREDTLCLFETLEKAESFANKYSNNHTYSKGNECGDLYVIEIPLYEENDDPKYEWVINEDGLRPDTLEPSL